MVGYIEVKETLMKFRKSRKLSVKAFCEGLTVSPEAYAEYEVNGKLPVTALIEIYKKYGHNLIERDEPKRLSKEKQTSNNL